MLSAYILLLRLPIVISFISSKTNVISLQKCTLFYFVIFQYKYLVQIINILTHTLNLAPESHLFISHVEKKLELSK